MKRQQISLEESPALVVGDLLDGADKVVKKKLEYLAEQEGIDLAYFEAEITIDFYTLSHNFQPLEKHSAKKYAYNNMRKNDE